jgi:large conductance mechanosensitive channel
MKKFFEEFQQFIDRGNVMNLAVGVMIGGAFNSIISSLVNDIITPFLSVILGKINLTALQLTIKTSDVNNPITLTYGNFLQAVLNFLLTALCLFIVIRTLNKVFKKKEAEKKPAEPTKEEQLLTEIRDLLKEK